MDEIARRELLDRRRGIVAWSAGYLAMVAISVASYPSVRDAPGIQDMVDELPAAVRGLFGGAALDLTSGPGYVNGRLLAFVLPIMLLVYVVGFGSRAVAGEHESGRLDLVLAYPVSRRRLVLARTAVMAGVVAFFVVLVFVALWLTGTTVSLDLGPADLWPAAVAQASFALFFGTLALFVGCLRLERGPAIAVPTSIALAGWLVGSLAEVATWLEPARQLSPLWWLTRTNPLQTGLDVAGTLLLLGGAALFLAGAVLVFDRRDLAA